MSARAADTQLVLALARADPDPRLYFIAPEPGFVVVCLELDKPTDTCRAFVCPTRPAVPEAVTDVRRLYHTVAEQVAVDLRLC